MNNIEQGFLSGLLAIDNAGEPRASSVILAFGLKQSHASVIKLIRRQMDALEQFGGVRFENQTFQTNGGPQDREVAMLNEQQATILICCMRNLGDVMKFKIGLVKEFYRMRDEIGRRNQNLWQRMQDLVAKEVSSQVKASFGSHLMLQRKKEIPPLRTEREILEAAIQPSLLN